jgi:AraC-like DNA-binding protein
MGSFATLRAHKIKDFEQLRDVVPGARRDVVQIAPGQLRGELVHATIGDLPIDAVTFNIDVRSRGAAVKNRVAIGMLVHCDDRVTRAAYESSPGDILITTPGQEHENRFHGGGSLYVISLSSDDIEAMFGADARVADAICRGNHYKGNAETVHRTIPRLRALLVRLGERDLTLTAEAAEFWKRAVIDAMTANLVDVTQSDRDGPLPSALKIVRQVEDYLGASGTRAVHISEICTQLHLTRRTLHRAFHEAVGIGPITFLRYLRLCAVHTALRSGLAAGETIANLAIAHGFLNVGRFSQYYREVFGENPSDTRRKRDTATAT